MANNVQLWKMSPYNGMSLKDHPAIGLLFRKNPQKAADMMIQILSVNRGKSLEAFLSQFPTKEFEDDTEFYWEIIGSSRRNIPLAFAVNDSKRFINIKTLFILIRE